MRLEKGTSSLDTVRRVATVLEVEPHELLDEEFEVAACDARPPHRPIHVQMTFEIPWEVYQSHALIRGLLRWLMQVARIQGGLTLDEEFPGSVRLVFWLTEEDAVRLREAFVEGRLDRLRAVELRLPRELQTASGAEAEGDEVVFRRDVAAMPVSQEEAIARLRPPEERPHRSLWAVAGIAALAASIALAATFWNWNAAEVSVAFREGIPFVVRDDTKGTSEPIEVGQPYDREAILKALADGTADHALLFEVDDERARLLGRRDGHAVSVDAAVKEVRGTNANVIYVLFRTESPCDRLNDEAFARSLHDSLAWTQKVASPMQEPNRLEEAMAKALAEACRGTDVSVTVWGGRRDE